MLPRGRGRERRCGSESKRARSHSRTGLLGGGRATHLERRGGRGVRGRRGVAWAALRGRSREWAGAALLQLVAKLIAQHAERAHVRHEPHSVQLSQRQAIGHFRGLSGVSQGRRRRR